MNPETIVNLQNRMTSVEQDVQDALKILKGLKIDNQMKLNANMKIPPGISCKVAYDSNGLIIKGDKLIASDIPTIQIDGVEGLRNLLEEKVSKKDLDKLQMNASESISNNKPGRIVGSGTKINYDENGRVVSSAELAEDDIPFISIDRIKHLNEELDIIKNSITPKEVQKEHTKIDPGTFPKITYDSDGRVLSGSKLSIDDIPMELITRVNQIEGKIPGLASQTTVDSISKILRDKIDGNPKITPGTYTKLTIDSKGLVTGGSRITVKDLPEITISDITDLNMILRKKADQEDLIGLNDTVSQVVASLSKIGDITGIQNKLKQKAEDSDVKDIQVKINSLQKLMDTLSMKIPNELILEQLQQIQNELSTISGRVYVLEKKMGMSDTHGGD